MILLNNTYSIEKTIEKEWVAWMKEKFIPIINDTGLCNCLLLKVEQIYDEGGVSFALQYSFNSKTQMEYFKDKFESKLNLLHNAKFRNKFELFVTVLETV
ncbi:MAG: DUF4286 family protein [Bacteroidales bacterium]|nr:DUF4286 family protein [Bacteroidales bacterium]